MDVFVDDLPRGNLAISGGTRGSIGLNRPWQTAFGPDEPETCGFVAGNVGKPPFATDVIPGWGVRQNAATPLEPAIHLVAIAGECLPWDSVYYLMDESYGGVLEHASKLAAEKGYPFLVTTHIGYDSGQNLPHLHAHIMEQRFGNAGGLPPEISRLYSYQRNSGRLVAELNRLRAVAGGPWAGMLYILPGSNPVDTTMRPNFFGELYEFVCSLIELYARKFVSTQGLKPDYSLGFNFDEKGRLTFAQYLPYLNNKGHTEMVSAILLGTPFIMPWPPEVTAKHLLEPGE